MYVCGYCQGGILPKRGTGITVPTPLRMMDNSTT